MVPLVKEDLLYQNTTVLTCLETTIIRKTQEAKHYKFCFLWLNLQTEVSCLICGSCRLLLS